ncbi:Microtubule-associated protein, microtubule dynamics during spindle orientation [Ascosphaera acerosa]|nr:Microtubule-associated protein, microtubule dynamics during spindle orientation [Ascosphaera acerosa]
MADQDEFAALPLTDRFTHKQRTINTPLPVSQNWKARKSGYEDAAKQFKLTADEDDPVFQPFLHDSGLWRNAVADSNVAAQAEGLTAYAAFLQYGGVAACTRL